MRKRCLKNGGRQKAFWGALIPAIATLAGSIYSAYANGESQEEAIEAQKQANLKNLRRQQMEQSAATMNNYFNTVSQEPEKEFVYKYGGRRKLKNAGQFMITDGGPVMNSSTGELIYPGQVASPGIYVDLGPKHGQSNPEGGEATGWVTADGKKFETQGGEAYAVKPNQMIVGSANLGKNGETYAEQILRGRNPKNVEKDQAKDRRHLRHGKGSPVGRTKAWKGAEFNTSDYVGFGANVVSSLLANIVARSNYNKLIDDVDYSLPNYVDEVYVPGPTNYDNSAKRAEVRRAQLMGRRSIAGNTASANTGLGLSQTLDTNAMYEGNKLWDEKFNKEAEYDLANAERRQGVYARNAAAKNAYYQKVAEIENQQLANKLGLRQATLDSNIGMIQGIGSSTGGFLQQGLDNYQADQARRMQLAASQYGSAERAASMGVDFSPSIMRALRDDAQTRMGRFDVGSTDYNAALDSYNFWNSKLSKPITNTPRKKRSLTSPSTINRPGIWYNPLTGQGQV